MTKHHAYFNPYFASPEFQDSHEREVEKSIENKVKSVWLKISKPWKYLLNKFKKSNVQ